MSNAQGYERSPSETLVLHTVTPDELPEGYVAGEYRTVAGLEVAEKELWLPGDHGAIESEVYEVPAALARNTIAYVERHYTGEDADSLFRNCHIGAAAMTGAGFLDWVDAVVLANGIIAQGRKVTDLEVGQWGAIGRDIEDYPSAYHSMVGLAPGLGLQTDDIGGPLSVVAHDSNRAHHKALYGPKLELHAPISGNPTWQR